MRYFPEWESAKSDGGQVLRRGTHTEFTSCLNPDVARRFMILPNLKSLILPLTALFLCIVKSDALKGRLDAKGVRLNMMQQKRGYLWSQPFAFDRCSHPGSCCPLGTSRWFSERFLCPFLNLENSFPLDYCFSWAGERLQPFFGRCLRFLWGGDNMVHLLPNLAFQPEVLTKSFVSRRPELETSCSNLSA